MSCKNSDNWCKEKLKIHQIYDHENTCKFGKQKRKRGSYRETKLYHVSNQHGKRGRLKDMYTALSDFCETSNENSEAVIFLMRSLKDNGKPEG